MAVDPSPGQRVGWNRDAERCVVGRGIDGDAGVEAPGLSEGCAWWQHVGRVDAGAGCVLTRVEGALCGGGVWMWVDDDADLCLSL